VDATTIASVQADIEALLAEDRYAADRAVLRRFYFDDAEPGESTRKFHEALLAAISEHQDGVAQMRRLAAEGTWPVRD
jgi:hypothetical protein